MIDRYAKQQDEERKKLEDEQRRRLEEEQKKIMEMQEVFKYYSFLTFSNIKCVF